jgi:hypothetical protein
MRCIKRLGDEQYYRQIGIGCKRIFHALLQGTLQLSVAESTWSYTLPLSTGKTRILSLDGRTPLEAVKNTVQRNHLMQWIYESCQRLDIAPELCNSLKGIVFEVRQGYKSKDSKRQNADIANAATAYTECYLTCVAILSQQIDRDIILRYTTEKWKLLTGILGDVSAHKSISIFMRDIVGYDLAGFFERHKTTLKKAVHDILIHVLTAE